MPPHSEIEHLNERVESIHNDVTKILGYIEGKEGFHVRLDRIEQQAERNKWWTRAAVGAAFSAFGTMIVKVLWHPGTP